MIRALCLSTNLDTPDKVSPANMRNVMVVHGRAALGLASATNVEALATVELLEHKAFRRLELERETSRRFIADEGGGAGLLAHELELLARWTTWYDEALQSVESLPVEGASAELLQAIETARERLANEALRARRSLE